MIRTHHLLICFINLCYLAVIAKAVDTTTHGYLGYPANPPWPNWAEAITNYHLINMSKLMMADMKVKLDFTKMFLQKYKFSMQYELGILASGVQTHFRHMLEVYKIYSNLNHFKRHKHNRNILIDAFHVIQGDYNQIRFERTLFYAALERHQAIRRERSKSLHKYSPGNPYHDEILAKMGQGYKYDPNEGRRRSFRGTDQMEAQDVLKQPQRKIKAEVGGLPSETKLRKPKAKKLWKPQTNSFVKEFPVGD